MVFGFEKKQRWIYTLELTDGNYYVGTTDDVEKRLKKHGKKHGAAWTFIYKPIKRLEVIDVGICTESEATVLENKLTIDYMDKYGWRKVRGGIFVSPNDFSVYNRLITYSKQHELGFNIEKPLDIPKSHLQKILKGTNKSKQKINVFVAFDQKTKATIFASISSFHGGKTGVMSVTKLEQFDLNGIINEWFEDRKNKFIGIKFEDVVENFEKLHSDKIVRVQKKLKLSRDE